MQTATTRLDEAKLNLEYTHITSPIDGKISRYFVSEGNLIRMDDTILTRVVSFNPIHFYFETSQQDLLKYLRLDKAGKRPSSDTHPSPIFIKLQDESDFKHDCFGGWAGLFQFTHRTIPASCATNHSS